MPHVMVVSSEGYFYSYNIDLENGGECSLMKQYRFVSHLISLSFDTDCVPASFPSLLDADDTAEGGETA